jgi:small subunit ribosomal protein S16
LVKIRLRRVGAKKKPSYRLVVADSRAPRDGAFIDVIGHYNPLTEPATIDIDEEKALSWLNQGAQPTEIVSKLLSKAGISKEPKAAKPAKARAAKKAKPATAKKAKPAKATAAKKAKPAAKKAKATVTKKPKPTKAGTTKKPKSAKAGVTKKSKPTKEKS